MATGIDLTDDMILEIEAAAKAATQGRWKACKELTSKNWIISLDAGDRGRGIALAETRHGVSGQKELANAQHIASANPSTVLALIAKLRDQESTIKELVGLLTESLDTHEMWSDVAPAVSLCDDIRAAIKKARSGQ